MSTSSSLTVELLADGGIRLTTLSGATGLASLRTTRDWIAEANRAGSAVRLRGSVTAAPAVPVAAEVRRLAASLDEMPSQPAPWPKGRSSIQTAASNGLTEQVTDLLERGVSPDAGHGRRTPYRLAMQRGHTEVMVALRGAGAALPRGLAPPAALPDAVVLRAYAPEWIWWLLVPFLALAAGAIVDGAYALAPAFVLLPLAGIGTVHLVLGNTRCAFDGPYVARRRGRRWQGPIDLRTLEALGYTPRGTVRMPLLWMLGQREAGDRPDVYAKSAFDAEQRAAIAAIDGLRFVPLYAAGGFLSPGFDRVLARHVDRANVIVGRIAAARVWPGDSIERTSPTDDKGSALSELSQAIAGDILMMPELSDPDWDTFSMVAEVTDDYVAITAFRYAESGPPVATEEPENDDLYWELRDRTHGTHGEAWDVVLVKIRRDTAQLVMNFVSGDAADLWRVTPENMAHLPESLRPRREDFQPG